MAKVKSEVETAEEAREERFRAALARLANLAQAIPAADPLLGPQGLHGPFPEADAALLASLNNPESYQAIPASQPVDPSRLSELLAQAVPAADPLAPMLQSSGLPPKPRPANTLTNLQPVNSPRIIDVELLKVAGIKVTVNDAFRGGLMALDPTGRSAPLTCSTVTLSWLEDLQAKGGRNWALVGKELMESFQKAEGEMRAIMLDLEKSTGIKVVDRRKITRPKNDRVDFVCEGISELVAQMAPFCDGRTMSGKQTENFVRRYSLLRDEMRALRASLTNAEGMFEIAQQQVVKLIGQDDV